MNLDFSLIIFFIILAFLIFIGYLLREKHINNETYKEEFRMDGMYFPYFNGFNLYRIASWIDVIFKDGVRARLALEEKYHRDIITNRDLGLYCSYVFFDSTDKNCKYNRGDKIDPNTIKYITRYI